MHEDPMLVAWSLLTDTGTAVIETGATLYSFLAGPPVSSAFI